VTRATETVVLVDTKVRLIQKTNGNMNETIQLVAGDIVQAFQMSNQSLQKVTPPNMYWPAHKVLVCAISLQIFDCVG
jgi:hypothetical protein